MANQWFIIQTLSGQEHKVKESIEKRVKTDEMQDYIKEVLVPMEKVVEVRNQKKTVSNRKLWPGYVFVDMLLLDDDQRVIEKPWYFIRETQGVIGFLSDPPQPTPTEEVEAIKNQISAAEETEKPKVLFPCLALPWIAGGRFPAVDELVTSSPSPSFCSSLEIAFPRGEN